MDLNEPLGMRPPPRSRRTLWLVSGGLVVLVAIAGLGLVLVTADPHGGEPYAVALVPRAQPRNVPAAIAVDPIETGSLAATRPKPTETGALANTDDIENGVKVFRSSPPGGSAKTPGPLIIDVSKALDDPLRHARSPLASATKNDGAAPKPRVAIFIGGMGLSEEATKSALETMPAAVTLAFVPYGADIAALVATAKTKGHEVLLQIPMENASGALPGPHALRAKETSEALAGDLTWLTSRFDGYDGVTNLLGAPVTANRSAMTAILKTVGGRGLYYLDDGTSMRSVAGSLAPDLGVGLVQADVVLDATADDAVVAANLERLLVIARRKGSAIGMASGLPDHLPAIARFAADMGDKGATLVPVASLVEGRPKTDIAKAATVTR